MSTATIASWLLTYLLHSTVLLGVAIVTSRMVGEKHLALQETVLRAALIGGIFTASLQMGLAVEPAVGVFHVNSFDRLQGVATATFEPAERAMQGDNVSALVSPPNTGAVEHIEGSWVVWLLLIWGAGMGLSLFKLGRSALDLRRLLTTRRLRPADRIFERLTRIMGLHRTVRLSTSRAIAMPFATGIRRPEVCCPERVKELAVEHQEGLYAHELAHLVRRDPSWQLFYRLGEAALCLQPLNRVARRRLEEIAEHLTDDRAVACTGDRLGLARCLVVMAHWGIGPEAGSPAAAFAAGPRLHRRIGRLLERRPTQRSASIWAAPLAACLLIACALTLPAVGSLPAEANTVSDVPTPRSTKTWSDTDEVPAPVPVPQYRQPLPRLRVLEETAPPVTPAPDLPAVPVAPAPSVALPHPAAEPSPVVAPDPEDAPVAEAPPTPEAVPARPVETPPTSPEKPPVPPAPEENARKQVERSREEARSRQREAQRKRAEAAARARERERSVEKESRVVATEARELARAAVEERAIAVVERQRIREEVRVVVEEARAEARALSSLASEQAREQAERARELAREAAERARASDADDDEARHRAEVRSTEQREYSREIAEKARRLAEEAEAEKNAERDRPNEDDE